MSELWKRWRMDTGKGTPWILCFVLTLRTFESAFWEATGGMCWAGSTAASPHLQTLEFRGCCLRWGFFSPLCTEENKILCS